MLIIWLSIDINDNQPSIHLLRPQSLSFVNSYLLLAGFAIASYKCLLAVKLDQNSKIILTKMYFGFRKLRSFAAIATLTQVEKRMLAALDSNENLLF